MKRTMSLMQEYRYILSSLLGLKKKVKELEEGGGGTTGDLTLEQARLNGNVLEGSIEVADGVKFDLFKNTSSSKLSFYFSAGGEMGMRNGDNSVGLSDNGFSIFAAGTRGIIGDEEYNKGGYRTAFAQLSDVYDANSYSTQEIKTGGTWIDGKPIYRRVFENMSSNEGNIQLNVYNRVEMETLIDSRGTIIITGDTENVYNTENSYVYDNFIRYFSTNIQPYSANETSPYWLTIQGKDVTSSEEIIDIDFTLKYFIIEYTKRTDTAPGV